LKFRRLLQQIASYLKCMNRNCRVAPLRTVCLCHCVAVGRFELLKIKIGFYGRFFPTKCAIPVTLLVQAQPATQLHSL